MVLSLKFDKTDNVCLISNLFPPAKFCPPCASSDKSVEFWDVFIDVELSVSVLAGEFSVVFAGCVDSFSVVILSDELAFADLLS